MNKATLIKAIVSSLTESLETLQNAARASRAEATHESSKAENKYDTRGLEAAYLAGGQARQARELLDAIKFYEALPLQKFASGQPVDLTAVVELEMNGRSSTFFIGPKNGGLEVTLRGTEVTVITPQSPLGQNLMGKSAGAAWTARVGGSTMKYRIVSVN